MPVDSGSSLQRARGCGRGHVSRATAATSKGTVNCAREKAREKSDGSPLGGVSSDAAECGGGASQCCDLTTDGGEGVSVESSVEDRRPNVGRGHVTRRDRVNDSVIASSYETANESGQKLVVPSEGEPVCGHSDVQIKTNVFVSDLQGMRGTGDAIGESDAFVQGQDNRCDEDDVIMQSIAVKTIGENHTVGLLDVNEDVDRAVRRNVAGARDVGRFSANASASASRCSDRLSETTNSVKPTRTQLRRQQRTRAYQNRVKSTSTSSRMF